MDGIKERDDFIREFENDCKKQSDDIIEKVCNRVWRSINKLPEICNDSFYGKNFTNMDAITVSYSHLGYSIHEINPYLEDNIRNEIEKEFDKLPTIEKIMLWYMDCSIDLRVDMEKIYDTIYDYFISMIDDHYNLKKIQSFCYYI